MARENENGTPDFSWIPEIDRLAQEANITELEWDIGGTRVKMKFNRSSAVFPQQPASIDQPRVTSGEFDDPGRYHKILAPLHGVFYSRPGPDKPTFVVEEQYITEGQPIGIIEAMKVMNEISASAPGLLIRMLVQEKQLVEDGQVLMILDITQPKPETPRF